MSAVLEITTPTLIQTNGVKPHLITVAEYDRMIELGVYTKYDKMELLNGKFIELPRTTPLKASISSKVSHFFYENLDKTAIIRYKSPIHLDNFSEP